MQFLSWFDTFSFLLEKSNWLSRQMFLLWVCDRALHNWKDDPLWFSRCYFLVSVKGNDYSIKEIQTRYQVNIITAGLHLVGFIITVIRMLLAKYSWKDGQDIPEKIWQTWKRMSIACSWSSWVFSSFVSHYSISLRFIFIQLFIVSKGLQGGFAFYESACVRPKNVTNVLFRNYIDSSNY